MQGEAWFLGIYPLPLVPNILPLWFYRKPAVLKLPAHVPDCIPPEYHYRVIVVKTILRNFRLFTDAIEDGPMKSITIGRNFIAGVSMGSPGEISPGQLSRKA